MSVNSESHEFEMRPPNIQLIGSHEINFLHISNSSFVGPQINGLLIREGNVDLLDDDARPHHTSTGIKKIRKKLTFQHTLDAATKLEQ